MALDPITAGIDLVSNVVSKIWPDKSEQERMEIAGAFALMQGQMKVNEVEASNPSIFVSGARPFIMWICGVGLGMQFLVAPILTWGSLLMGKSIVLPPLDMGTLITLLGGLLGLGTMRTVEKLNGVARR
jgi:hypothetical protein